MSHQTPRDPFGSIPIAGDENTREAPVKEESPPGPEPSSASEAPTEKQSPPGPQPPAGPGSGKPARRRRRRPGLRSWLPWLLTVPVLLLLLYLAAGYLLMPYLLGSYLPSRLAGKLERSVTVGSAKFDPWNLTLTLQNTIVGPRSTDPEDTVDPLLSFGSLEMDLSASSLFRFGLISNQVTIDRPFVHLVRTPAGDYNLLQLFSNADQAGAALPRFSINNVRLTNGRLLFDDLPSQQQHQLEEVSLALPTVANFDYQADQYLHPRFAAKVNGSPLEVAGETKMEGGVLEARLALQLKEFAVADFSGYLPVSFNFKVTKGKADLDLNLIVASGGEAETRLQIEGTGRFTDLWLHDGAGKELAVLPSARATLAFAPLTDTYRVKDLLFLQPEVLLERAPEGAWIFPWLEPTAPPPARPEPSDRRNFAIDKLRVENGKLSFIDRRVNGGYSDTWSQIHLSVEGLATGRGPAASFALSGRNAKAAGLTAQGKLHTGPFRAEGLAVLDQLGLPPLAAYLTGDHGLRLTRGILAKLESHFRWQPGLDSEKPALTLTKTALQLEDLVLAREDTEWLRLERAALRQGSLALPEKSLRIGTLEASTPWLLCRRDREGSFNWQFRNGAAEADRSPWQVDIDALQVREGTLLYQDRRLREPVELEFTGSELELADLSNHRSQESRLTGSAALAGGGRLALSGSLALNPWQAELDCRLDDLPLTSLQPLLAEHLTLRPTAGRLHFNGRLRLPEPALKGALELSDLQAVDGQNREIIRCDRLQSPQLSLSFSPLDLQTELLTMERPALHWPLTPATSLPQLLTRSGGGSEAAEQPLIQVGGIEVHNGLATFTDPGATPPYSATVQEISGQVGPVANRAATNTNFSFRGRLANGGPVTLTGSAGLMQTPVTARLSAELQELPLATIAPYLTPHLGYRVISGRLDLQATLQQAAHRLTAENRLEARELILGEQISRNSSLPLTLALLRKPSGRFSLEIPVRGATDDPAFSYREELARAVRGYLLKTTVSPFLLLPHSLPTATPEYVMMPPGQAQLSAEGREHLEALAVNLKERPAITLTLRGFAAGETDRQVLLEAKRLAFTRKELEQEALHSSRLTASYGKEEITTEELPPPASHRLQALRVTDDELLELARERAEAAREFLSKQGIEPDRLQVDPGAELVKAGTPGRPGNRVEIKLGTVLGGGA